jgi:hypothetical protein
MSFKLLALFLNLTMNYVKLSYSKILKYIGAPIFASQGLRSAPRISTLGRLSQNVVIPAYRPLADLLSSVHLHYIIINQWERLYCYLFDLRLQLIEQIL